jgi:hypothetical protein
VYSRGFDPVRDDEARGSEATPLAECHDRLQPELVVRYPSRLAHLRSIYERTRRHNAASAQLPVDDRQRMLDLSLADKCCTRTPTSPTT